VGRLERPRRAIGDDDHDGAHKDMDNPKVIRFITANDEFMFMKDKVLRNDQGVTHDVFKEEKVEEELDENGEPIKKVVR